MLTFVRYFGVYYTFGLLDCVGYNEDFVISRFVIWKFVIPRSCPIHFTVTLDGRKSIVRSRVLFFRGSINRGSTIAQ